MPWPLVSLGTHPDAPSAQSLGLPWLPVGGYFFRSGDRPMPGLGAIYLNTAKATRLPVYILTPDGWWCPDEMAYGHQGWHGNGWTVTGAFPKVSITPSINFPGRFHSWVRDGLLLDDIEGRVFPALQPAT